MPTNQKEIVETTEMVVALTEAFLATHKYNQCAADAFYYMGLILVTPTDNLHNLQG